MGQNKAKIIIFLLGIFIGSFLMVGFYEADGRFAVWQVYDQWRTRRQNDALLAQIPVADALPLVREELFPFDPSPAGFQNDRQLYLQLNTDQFTIDRNEGIATFWDISANDSESFQASVAPNRERLRSYLGPLPDGAVHVSHRETVELPISHCPNGPTQAEKLTVSSRRTGFEFDAYLVAPVGSQDNGHSVVALHGHSSSPERLIGLEGEDYTRHMALRLACAGYAVIVPTVSSNGAANSAISALVALQGETLYGLMVSIVQSSLDIIESEYPDRLVGLYGISNGGLLALFTSAIDPRSQFIVAESILTPYWESTLIPSLSRDGRKDYFYYFNGPVWLEFDMAQLTLLSLPDIVIFTVGSLDEERNGWEDQWATVTNYYDLTGNESHATLILFHGHHELAEDYAISHLTELLK